MCLLHTELIDTILERRHESFLPAVQSKFGVILGSGVFLIGRRCNQSRLLLDFPDDFLSGETLTEQVMDAELVTRSLPVAVRMDVHLELSMLVVDLCTVPLDADAFSFFDVSDLHDRTDLFLDLHRVRDLHNVVRLVVVSELSLRVHVDVLGRKLGEVVHDTGTRSVRRQISQDDADPFFFAETARVVRDAELDWLLSLIHDVPALVSQHPVDVLECLRIVELHQAQSALRTTLTNDSLISRALQVRAWLLFYTRKVLFRTRRGSRARTASILRG